MVQFQFGMGNVLEMTRDDGSTTGGNLIPLRCTHLNKGEDGNFYMFHIHTPNVTGSLDLRNVGDVEMFEK